MKLPSLNQYINECRRNKFAGSKMKKQVQADISLFLKRLPEYRKPIFIEFTWVEDNHRRDLDNVCFAKKFILDTLQELGKIPNDNQRYIKGFKDNFGYDSTAYVIIDIKEAENEGTYFNKESESYMNYINLKKNINKNKYK